MLLNNKIDRVLLPAFTLLMAVWLVWLTLVVADVVHVRDEAKPEAFKTAFVCFGYDGHVVRDDREAFAECKTIKYVDAYNN